MELEFKPDFEAARERWDQFWKGRNEGPLLWCAIPRKSVEPVKKPRYAAGADGNYEPVIDQILGWAETHEFLGDAIPFIYPEFAADHFSALLGADLKFIEGQGGGWPVPFVEDWASAEIRFARDGKWWGRTVEFVEAIKRRCDGKILIAAPTFVANLDALAAIRGGQKLLMDMVADPSAVHAALQMVTDVHREIVEAFAELLEYGKYGSINRHGLYSNGVINVPQCDLSCMIGPDMFEEFVVPYLRQEMQHLDAAEYHLDGPGAIRHVEALCAIEELDVMQWMPGAGNSEKDWSALHRKIDGLGKGQIFGQYRGYTFDELKKIWAETDSRRLFMIMGAEDRSDFEKKAEELARIEKNGA